jgi:diaminohydroxyphosphoribosylaminopyrimidine deaminase/5-amino-6-(5-phosphoribosylamino)uracil reductase
MDAVFMQAAIDAALLGLGQTAPNPIVGAVIVGPDNEILATGFHAGGDHAEVAAIKNFKAASATGEQKPQRLPSGSRIYVSLEPCNHTGKSGPCTEAILAAGISEVIYAVSDPNPIAAGGGAYLRSKGLIVRAGVKAYEAAWANRDWLTKLQMGRPRIVWKVAATLDGYIAAADGSSKWITSTDARQAVWADRRNADAIVTSTATVLADNPALTGRQDLVRNPDRFVVGLRTIPNDFQIFNNEAKTSLINSHDLADLLTAINQPGYNRVMIEAGGEFAAALLAADLIDEVLFYSAPIMLGKGRKFIADLGVNTLAEAIAFEVMELEKIGTDVLQVLNRVRDTEQNVHRVSTGTGSGH